MKARTLELRQANEQLTLEVYDRKKAEAAAKQASQEAESANLAKSEFLATMSHEIRTPLNAVLGFTELLRMSELDSEQLVWTSYIQNSGNSLLHIIDDILDFSKIQAGKLKLENVPYSLNSALEEVTNTFAPMAGEKGIQLDYLPDNRLPLEVMGDPIRFKQILTNLVSNAIKFTERGRITVSAQWIGNPSKGSAEIRVADTGIGIPKDKINKLFERFSQVDSSTTRRFGGTGLGLAICKQIVLLMQGHIWVESEASRGTTFAFKLPLEVPDDAQSSRV